MFTKITYKVIMSYCGGYLTTGKFCNTIEKAMDIASQYMSANTAREPDDWVGIYKITSRFGNKSIEEIFTWHNED